MIGKNRRFWVAFLLKNCLLEIGKSKKTTTKYNLPNPLHRELCITKQNGVITGKSLSSTNFIAYT